jgi:hypothetical protein
MLEGLGLESPSSTGRQTPDSHTFSPLKRATRANGSDGEDVRWMAALWISTEVVDHLSLFIPVETRLKPG